jgi:hypothetical protein
MMAEAKQVAAKADQPRVTTGDLTRQAKMPSLTYRQIGIKTSNNRGQRESSRK